MAPTVVSGDLVWVSFGAAVPGDVVQARMDEAESPQLARVVAGPGSVVEVSAGVLYVDGQPLSRGGPHIMETCDGQRIRAIAEQWGGGEVWVVAGADMAPARVPEGHVWLMGDNRPNAGDSQRWGAIDSELLDGVATHVVWSSKCDQEHWPNRVKRIR